MLQQFHNNNNMAKPMNKGDIDPTNAKEYNAEVGLTQMEGYTNLALIKEEDFNLHGVGHFSGANASKRIYNAHAFSKSTKGRKASEATTVQAPDTGHRKQFISSDNRYNTPLKLPNLKTPATKKIKETKT